MHVFGFKAVAGDPVRPRGETGHVHVGIDHVHRVVCFDVLDVDVVATQWGTVPLVLAILKSRRFGVFGQVHCPTVPSCGVAEKRTALKEQVDHRGSSM